MSCRLQDSAVESKLTMGQPHGPEADHDETFEIGFWKLDDGRVEKPKHASGGEGQIPKY